MRGTAPRALKNLALGLLVTCLILLGAEAAQRVRYALRYGHTYWLKYGLVEKPKDYRAHIERHYLTQQNTAEKEPKQREADARAPMDLKRRFEFFTQHYDGYYKLRPGKYKLKGGAAEGLSYTINSQGLRGREFEVPKPMGVVRIVCLGGSSTFGIMNDDAHTYPALLEELLDSGGKTRYEVINAGFSGATLEHLGAFFANDRQVMEPDIVVIYSLFNNIFPRQFQSPSQRWAWKLRLWLSQRSLVFLTALEKYSIWRYGQAFSGAGRYDFHGLGRWIDDERVWTPFRENLSGLIDDAKGHGVRVLLVKQAVLLDKGAWDSLFQPQGVWKAHLETARSIIDEAGMMHGVPVLDAQVLFPPKEAEGFFDDPVHLTDAGNALLAEAIQRKLSELGWTGK